MACLFSLNLKLSEKTPRKKCARCFWSQLNYDPLFPSPKGLLGVKLVVGIFDSVLICEARKYRDEGES